MTIFFRLILISIFSVYLTNATAQINQTVVNGAMTSKVTFQSGCLFKWTNDKPSIGLAATGSGTIAQFTAVNNTNNAVIATIAATPVLADYAYIVNAGSNNVSVINLSTNLVEKTIPVGTRPLGVAVSPDGKEVYIANQETNNISVIDATSNTVVANIAVGKMPSRLVFSPDGSRVYVSNSNLNNIYNSNTVSVINTATRSVISTIRTGDSPSDLLTSPDGTLLYVSTGSFGSKIEVYNTATYALLKQYPTHRTYSSSMVLSPDGKTLYVTNTYSNNLSFIDLATSAITEVATDELPNDLAISPNGKSLYVTHYYSYNIKIIDIATKAVTGTIPTASTQNGISFSSDGSKFMTASGNNKLAIFDRATNTLLTTINVGTSPYGYGNFIKPSMNSDCAPVTFTITVNPSGPNLSTGGLPAAQTTTYGDASTASTFTVNGTGLIEGVVVNSPAGFEVSLDNVTFSPTLTINNTGTISSKTVYVRLKDSNPAGSYGGNISVKSSGVMKEVAIPESKVIPVALTIRIGNQTKSYGETLTDNSNYTTFSTTGLKNGESAGSVTVTYGTGAGPSAAAGIYAGAAAASALSGGTFLASNYQINYQTADIIVNKVNLIVTADRVTKIYGATLENATLASGFNVAGLRNGERINTVNLIYNAGYTSGAPVGNYPGAVSLSGATGTYSSDNYNLTYITGDLEITARPISVTAAPKSKLSGDADPTLTYFISSGALVGTDSFTGQLVREGGEGPGPYAIKQGTLTLNNNYLLSFNEGIFTIGKPTAVISFATLTSHTYGDTDFDPGATSDYPSTAITYQSDNPSVAIIIGQKIHITGAGSANITASQPAGAEFNAPQPVSRSFTVKQAIINLSAFAASKTYGDPDPPLTYAITIGELVNGDQLTGALARIPGENVGQHTINQSSLTAGSNYQIIFNNANLTINPRTIRVTADAKSKIFGGQDPILTYGVSNGNLMAGDGLTGQLIRDAGESPGAYPIRQGTVNAGENYNIIYDGAVLTIAKALLTIKADNKQRKYGQSNPSLTVSYSGFAGNDNESTLTSLPLITTIASASSGVGTYDINASGASAPGYVINYEPGSLVIQKVPLKIIADDKQKSAGEQNPQLTAHYEGFVNGESTNDLDQQPLLSTSANEHSGPGNYPISVIGASSENYEISYVPGLMTISPVTFAHQIPNSFTPNGDGINDRWELTFLQNYPKCQVQVFNRLGTLVFSSISYGVSWDGTYNRNYLPSGTYYYVIDLKNGEQKIAGNVTIIK